MFKCNNYIIFVNRLLTNLYDSSTTKILPALIWSDETWICFQDYFINNWNPPPSNNELDRDIVLKNWSAQFEGFLWSLLWDNARLDTPVWITVVGGASIEVRGDVSVTSWAQPFGAETSDYQNFTRDRGLFSTLTLFVWSSGCEEPLCGDSLWGGSSHLFAP